MCVDPSFVIHLVGREKEYHHPIKKVWHLKCGKMVDVEKGRIIHFLKIEEGFGVEKLQICNIFCHYNKIVF